MTTAFSQPASCCTVEQKMGMEGQGEREVRISAKLLLSSKFYTALNFLRVRLKHLFVETTDVLQLKI